MRFVYRSNRVARKAASLVAAAAVLTGATLASSLARAELLRPNVPTLTWGAAIYAWMPPHEERFALPIRSSIVWTPSFSAFSIGVSGMSLFRSGTHVMTVPSFGARKEPWSLCIGPACPGHVRASANDGDPGAAAKAGSTRFITDIGPVAVKALGLFSTPVPSREHPVAMRVSPMFACGGGGLEMRAAWW